MAEAHSVPRHWDSFRDSVRARVTPVTWQTWLAPLQAADGAHNGLTLLAPSELHRRWVREKYLDVLHDACRDVYGSHVELRLEASEASPPTHLTAVAGEEDEEDHAAPNEPLGVVPRPAPARHGLVGRYTFDNFVVGPSNRFAHAAAMAVAEQPGTQYNPLFSYGGAGLGKTHLLHAIGHHALELRPSQVVKYVTSEKFFNEFIDGIRRKRMDGFKSRYRTTDVLLLDDVQFFEGKEQILEEFFHTFNSLYEAGKQVVITSDRHPKHLASLEDRLRSRFEWGLLTDIQPPDVETRLAILKKNVDATQMPVPETVLELIARRVVDNIRELEGALTRVTAYATLTHQEITLDMARDVLQDLLPPQEARPVTPEEILQATAESFGFTLDQLTGPSRKQPLALSRQIGMYLCRELTDLSLPKIGRVFGGRDHTTVIHAVDKIKTLMKTDQEIFDSVTALSQNLRRT